MGDGNEGAKPFEFEVLDHGFDGFKQGRVKELLEQWCVISTLAFIARRAS